MKLNGLDLFSGIGGITRALNKWVTPIAYCENDRYAQSVLLSRMAANELPRAPIWDDVTSLSGSMLPNKIDIIYGGFPCQDISCAGTGKGLEGKRSGLFFEITRLAKEINPLFIFLENVPAIRTRGLDVVLKELTLLRYDCRWTTLSASAIGAPHKRERWFLLAHSMRSGLERQWQKPSRIQETYVKNTRSNWWAVEPNVDRVANGVPFRVDRIKCLGNSVVPEQVKEVFKKLIGL